MLLLISQCHLFTICSCHITHQVPAVDNVTVRQNNRVRGEGVCMLLYTFSLVRICM